MADESTTADMADGRPVAVADRLLLEVRQLSKHYTVRRHPFGGSADIVRAVDGVDLRLDRGETLGLVGESGCGKTTLGKCIIRAACPSSGEVRLRLPDGRVVDLGRLRGRELRAVRPHMHMVFQDPHASLNPRMTVFDIVAEPLVCNRLAKGRDLVGRVAHLLEVVGLDPSHTDRYPHAFSGGQRQRIGIARSLAASPELIVCDEPVSALDVSVQAQVLNLLQDVQRQFGMAYLFVAHDLAVVEHVADRVAVMYAGRIVETSTTADLYASPQHPYTEALLAAVPKLEDAKGRPRFVPSGEPANPANLPPGCAFHPRCHYAAPCCREERPTLREIRPGHAAACHFAHTWTLRGVR